MLDLDASRRGLGLELGSFCARLFRSGNQGNWFDVNAIFSGGVDDAVLESSLVLGLFELSWRRKKSAFNKVFLGLRLISFFAWNYSDLVQKK